MRVWIYPEKKWADLGSERWAVKWQTVKPEASKRITDAEACGDLDEVDPDDDLVHHARYYSSERIALREARRVVNAGNTAYGAATVTKEVVEWAHKEARIAEWASASDPVFVD